MREMNYTIGIDFGTLSGRAVLVSVEDGSEIASAVCDYPHGVIDRILPSSGEELPPAWALQDPADYLLVLGRVIREVREKAGVRAEDVIGLSVDFTCCTVMPIYSDGTPLCFTEKWKNEKNAWCKLWKHHAAQQYADRMTETALARGEKWLAAYGGKVSCEGALPKLWQMLEEAPQVYAAAAYWMEATDWLVWQLCGKPTMSSCCAGYKYLYYDGTFPSEDYFSALDSRLAHVIRDKCGLPILPIYSRAGMLTQRMGHRLGLTSATAVAVGMIDAHACLPAAGIAGPGEMVMILGTSACLMACGKHEHSIPGCYAVKDGMLPGYWGYEGGQNSVGDLFAWMLNNFVPASLQPYHMLC